jgi:carbon starvation protein
MVAVIVLSVWCGWKLESEFGFAIRLNLGEEGVYDVGVWIIILLVYVYFASTLPVHRLLQPRDAINSYMLFLSMALITLGVIVAHPAMVAPAVRADVPENTPPLIPLLFVTIACGAVSGFHSLVSSGTSSKQLNSEADARFIGYGGMIAEGALAVLAVIAVAAGLGAAKWRGMYSTYGGSSMGLQAFIQGAGHLITQFTFRVGLSSAFPPEAARLFVSVVIICFAATTLDTATRIQRYVVSEIGAAFKLEALRNRYVATSIAVGTAAVLAFSQGWRTQTAMLLWQIFGTINQLLAAMALLIVTVYLRKKGKNIAYSVVPMILLLFITGWAMIWKVSSLIRHRTPETMAADMVLVFIGIAALVLELFVVIFGVRALLSSEGKGPGQPEEDSAEE